MTTFFKIMYKLKFYFILAFPLPIDLNYINKS